MVRREALGIVLGLLCAPPLAQGCISAKASGPTGPGSGILFIGNSLTYWNDLPLIVQAVFDAAGATRYDVGIESYQLAAHDVGGMYFPVADAWRAVWRRDSTVALYSPDGLHPSLAASYLAALVMYGVMADKSPVGLSVEIALRDGRPLVMPATLAALLQAAAAEAIQAAR